MARIVGGTTTTRRRLLRRAGALGGAAAAGGLAGCTWESDDDEPTPDEPLRVATYGGTFEAVVTEQLLRPFREETGVAVESVPRASLDVGLAGIESAVENDSAPVDLVLATVTELLRGEAEELWLAFEPDDLENLQYVADEFVHEREEGIVDDAGVVGVGALSWYLNLVQNRSVVEEPVDTWTALWDPTYEGALGLLGLPASGFLLDVTAEVQFGGRDVLDSREGVERVFEKLEEVTPQAGLWYDDESEFTDRLVDGDVPAGMLYNDVALSLQADHESVESNFVEEGSVLDHGCWCALRTTERPAAAATFVDYASRPAVQDRLAEQLHTGPVVTREHSSLPAEAYERVAGPGPAAAIVPKYELYVEEEGWINERWQELVGEESEQRRG